MAPRSFLFVNKECKSDSLSNSHTDRVARIEIHQHAGNNASRKKMRREAARATSLDGAPTIFAQRSPPEALTTGTDVSPTFEEEDPLRTSATTLPPKTVSRQKFDPISPSKPRLLQPRPFPRPRASGSSLSDGLARLASRERHMLLSSPAPTATISLVPNHLTTLTPREHQVLQHYASTWLPVYVGHGTTTGFTALCSKHLAFSSFIMQSALQTDDPFSLYAFLTMAAQRMHLTNSLPDQDSSPEYFSVRSVQALRRMASRPFSEELVLALANLVLGEAYMRREGRSGSPAISIYRVMQRNLIIKAGGLHVLSPSTAQVAVAYDLYTSQGTLTLPYFDVYQSSELLGLDASTLPDSQSERHDYIRERLNSVDLALRVLLESSHDLSEVITAIGRLESYAIKALAAEIWSKVPRKLALNAATLQRSGPREVFISPREETELMAADALWMHIRQQIYAVWVWHTALGMSISIARPKTSESTTMSSGSTSYAEPTCVTRAMFQLWRQLDQVQSQLQHTSWKVRMKTVLWICALCLIVATGETEQQAYLQRFEGSAAALEIDREEELRVILSTMLPLEQLCPDWDAVSWSWSELVRFRGRCASEGTAIGMRHAVVRKEEGLGRTIISECLSEADLTP